MKPQSSRHEARQAAKARLTKQLRANLMKRKAQARARAAGQESGSGSGPTSQEDEPEAGGL